MIDPIELIMRHEGLSLKPYRCPAGYPTIGYGLRYYPNGAPVKMSDEPISRELAEAYLRDYVINNIKPHLTELDLTNSQEAAIISLVFNIGWSAFSKSKCYKAIKAKDWGTVFAQWDWIRANRKVLPGLVKRRAEELYLFFKDI